MSLNYAAALSKYPDKGVLGTVEIFEDSNKVEEKASILSSIISTSQNIVFLTGAGISTSAGIPDFRGPHGVWTLEEKGLTPEVNIDFTQANPSLTHFAINAIADSGKDCYIVSQNVDNLHMKSGNIIFIIFSPISPVNWMLTVVCFGPTSGGNCALKF